MFDDDQFNGFRGVAHGNSAEIDTCLQVGSATEVNVPVEDEGTICGSPLDGPLIELTACNVEHLHQHVHLRTCHTLGDNERSPIPGGVLRADDVQIAGGYVVRHHERETGNGRVVQHVPCTELQGVGAVGECRYAEADRTAAIVTKVKGEIVVEVIGLRRFSVDDELEVVADAAARKTSN